MTSLVVKSSVMPHPSGGLYGLLRRAWRTIAAVCRPAADSAPSGAPIAICADEGVFGVVFVAAQAMRPVHPGLAPAAALAVC